MRSLFLPLLAFSLLLAAARPLPASLFFKKNDFAWENAVIHLEVATKEYSYAQPWDEGQRRLVKTGVVIPGHLILTTADGMANATMIYLQKGGGGLFSSGNIVWVDYQANLCAISTTENDFWAGLEPATLADPVPVTGSARILRWQGDHLDDRPADLEEMIVNNSALSFVSVPEIKLDTTVSGLGGGEVLASGNKLIGLVCQQEGDIVAAVPTSFISSILKARAADSYTGLGYFDFTWDPVQNPLNLQYLKLSGPPRGVIVKETGLKPGVVSLIHPRDIILNIDGFDIDSDGNYHDPQYKKLSLENLSSRQKWAGQTCQFKILRDGKELNITYRLPKAEYRDELVPQQTYDHSPQYVLAGGFVFVPLTEDYLRSWGSDWRQHAPFRLAYYENGKVSPNHLERVVLSQVLPDPINIGYESLRNLVVDKINGQDIRDISDVSKALQSPINGYDVFTFAPGEETREAVLNATNIDQANTSIMAHFHIRYDHVLNSEIAGGENPVGQPTAVSHQQDGNSPTPNDATLHTTLSVPPLVK